MKYILYIFLSFFTLGSYAQSLDELDEALAELDSDSSNSFIGEGEIFYEYRISPQPKMTMAQFDNAVNKYVKDNYPSNVESYGRVYVEFIVEPDGKLTNFQVNEGLAKPVNQVVIEAIKSLGDWEPGISGVVNVRCYKKQPIMVDKDYINQE